MTDKLPTIAWDVGPGSLDWKRLLKLAKQNKKDGFSCAIATPGRAATARRAEFDPGWAKARLYVNYDHISGVGNISLTYAGARYGFRLLRSDPLVRGVIVPFDGGLYEDVIFHTVVLDLGKADTVEPARTQDNGFRQAPERAPVTATFTPARQARTARVIRSGGERAEKAPSRTVTVVTRPGAAANSSRKRVTNAAWSRRERSIANMVAKMAAR